MFNSMATTSASKPVLMKQLKEHLKEQQEPFKLSTYLSERRYTMKSSDGGTNNSYCSIINSSKKLKEYKCGSDNLKRRKTLHAPRTMKSLLYKLINSNDRQELSSYDKVVKDNIVSETIDMMQQIAETNWFSTVSNNVTQHHNVSLLAETSPSLNLIHFEQQKADTDIHQQWNWIEDDKQLSPETVLKGPSTSSLSLTRAKGKHVFSWTSVIKSLSEKHIQVGLKVSDNKKALLNHSKQQLFNYIGKGRENSVRNSKRQKHVQEFWSLEGLGRTISSTLEEWNYFQQPHEEICIEMGDSIMGEIIDEIFDL